jgi:choline dehydrogenase
VHGTGGEWRIENQRLRWDILDDWARAAQACGIPATTISTPATTRGWGISRSPSGRAGGGTRQGVPAPGAQPADAGDPHHAQVQGLIFDGARCTGVRYRRGGQMVEEARADSEVILCAGAIGSAQLLQLAGIGPAACCRIWGSRCGATATRARTCRTICNCG